MGPGTPRSDARAPHNAVWVPACSFCHWFTFSDENPKSRIRQLNALEPVSTGISLSYSSARVASPLDTLRIMEYLLLVAYYSTQSIPIRAYIFCFRSAPAREHSADVTRRRCSGFAFEKSQTGWLDPVGLMPVEARARPESAGTTKNQNGLAVCGWLSSYQAAPRTMNQVLT